ncbi:MAG: transglycosylase domain-containing protein, partial [Chloroflexi bacterium]|nr:transglycosylase domain-containing protein [Chloroflexota bacterium]
LDEQSRRPQAVPRGEAPTEAYLPPIPAAPPAIAPVNPAHPALNVATLNVGTFNVQRPAASAPRRASRLGGCLLKATIAGAFVSAALILLGGGVLLYEYFSIARTLPSIAGLREKAAQFETTRIYDRNGDLLYEILDPQAGRRTYVPLKSISPYLVAATIATEDKAFYSHPGFDPLAIVRAIWQNYRSGETVSGASTITQQLTRALLFDAEQRNQRTNRRKIREIILAAEITRQYSKDEILELYLNEIYYGNLAYGVQAAAETYFHTGADRLTLAQASFLAGLPQAPAVYDVFTNKEATLLRQQQVLTLLVLTAQEQGCIYVSNSPQPVCVSPDEAGAAAAETAGYNYQPPRAEIKYPHWVTYVRSLLEQEFDPQMIYRSGFSVYTTLDPALQDLAQRTVIEQLGPSSKAGPRPPCCGTCPPSSRPPAIPTTPARPTNRSTTTGASTARSRCAARWATRTTSRRSRRCNSWASMTTRPRRKARGWSPSPRGWASPASPARTTV